MLREGNSLNLVLGLQGKTERIGSVLAQHAVLTQHRSLVQDVPLQFRGSAVPGVPGLAIRKVHAVDALAARTLDPIGRGAHAHTELGGYSAQAAPRTNRAHQAAAALFDRAFLAMSAPSKERNLYQLRLRRLDLDAARGRSCGRPPGSLRFCRDPKALRIDCPTNAET